MVFLQPKLLTSGDWLEAEIIILVRGKEEKYKN